MGNVGRAWALLSQHIQAGPGGQWLLTGHEETILSCRGHVALFGGCLGCHN